MRLKDVKAKIDNYFENVTEEEFIDHLESYNLIEDDKNEYSNKSLVEQIKTYLDNATSEQLEKDYEELRKWSEIGPTVDEYFGNGVRL